MAVLGAFLIFVALSAAGWAVAVALYRGTVGGPDPADHPHYRAVAAAAVGFAALTAFVPFLGGYALGLAGWAWAAFRGLGLPRGRAAVLFALLAATSLVSRLAVAGVLAGFAR